MMKKEAIIDGVVLQHMRDADGFLKSAWHQLHVELGLEFTTAHARRVDAPCEEDFFGPGKRKFTLILDIDDRLAARERQVEMLMERVKRDCRCHEMNGAQCVTCAFLKEVDLAGIVI